MDRWTDEKVIGIVLAHPWAFGSGEQKLAYNINQHVKSAVN